ncbi:hypothetical protein PCANC_09833 [Puccinia coronata f. sp. avenae]|uniref:Uncharacterized protein n=1 Tax=Puccinia coronata f. sp. avenae TaxID=200324 RepID=A0A2N5T0M6_9BASI|nr:hypothetical protein PCANC_09833 [Puccinia coronata f. sp. avenae]
MNQPGYHGTYKNPQSLAAPWPQQQPPSTMFWAPLPLTSHGYQSQPPHNDTFSQRIDGMSGNQDPWLYNRPLPPPNSQSFQPSHPSSPHSLSAIYQQDPFHSQGPFDLSNTSSNVNLASSVAPQPYLQPHPQARCNSQPLPQINLLVLNQTQICQQPSIPSNQTSNNSHPTARPARLLDCQISRSGHPDKGFLQGTMSGPNPVDNDVEQLLTEEEMKRYRDMTLTELRTIAINSAKRL